MTAWVNAVIGKECSVNDTGTLISIVQATIGVVPAAVIRHLVDRGHKLQVTINNSEYGEKIVFVDVGCRVKFIASQHSMILSEYGDGNVDIFVKLDELDPDMLDRIERDIFSDTLNLPNLTAKNLKSRNHLVK